MQQNLARHREQQAAERRKLAKHRKKALENPLKYMSVVIDGMDQKKTTLPHFLNVPKDVPDECFVKIHLVGAMVFKGSLRCKVFLTYPNLHGDPNLTITILNKVLCEQEHLPPVLYLQLDNTTRENKNQALFAYCAMLVELKIFKKVKLGFLLVGHTHDQIDQMFSRFSVRLRRKKAFSLPTLVQVIEDSYTPSPNVELLKETADFREFIFCQRSARDQAVNQLNDLTFQHHIKFYLKDGESYLHGKKYTTTQEWTPPEGLRFLKYIPSTALVERAEQLPLKNPKESKKKNSTTDKALDAIEDGISSGFKYFTEEDKTWWENFFLDQQVVNQNLNSRLLEEPFQWPTTFDQPQNQAGPSNASVAAPVEAEEDRVMYLGPRRKNETPGNITEITNGMLIACPAEEDEKGRPFWIARVVDTIKEEGLLTKLKIHWLVTRAVNAYEGKYDLEMRTEGKGRKAKKVYSKDELDLKEVRILCYGFTLKTDNRLRQTTINILKRACTEDESEDGSDPSNSVDSDEEDNSSTSSSDSERSEGDDDGVNEHDDVLDLSLITPHTFAHN